MVAKIASVGFEIPDAEEISITKNKSLDDYDIIFFDPSRINDELDFTKTLEFKNGKVTLDESNSNKAYAYFEHWEKEVELALEAGKTFIVWACQNNEIKYAKKLNPSSHGWNLIDKTVYSIFKADTLKTSALEGDTVIPKQSNIHNLLIPLSRDISYSIVFENVPELKFLHSVLETKSGRSVGLYGVYGKKEGKVLIIPKPTLKKDFEGRNFTPSSKEKLKTLIKLASDLHNSNEANIEIPPEWVSDNAYKTQSENDLNEKLSNIDAKIKNLQENRLDIEKKVEEEFVLKQLLFGKGKPLETAVNVALNLLGIKSKQYRFYKKDLEIDHLADMGNCVLIGECEGKDNKDIDKTKLSQLLTNKGEYYDEPKVDPAKPIKLVLFGNPMRLKVPNDRTLDFTKACKDIAKNNQVSLVKTVDLFKIAAYIKDTGDKDFAKSCVDSIFNTEHGVVSFPKIPKRK